MKTTRGLRALLLASAAAAPLLAGCAGNEPYAAPQAAPATTLRAPVVAPSGYTSPWFWPMPDNWWPFQ